MIFRYYSFSIILWRTYRMNWQEKAGSIKTPKWLKQEPESIGDLTSEIIGWDSIETTDTSMTTTDREHTEVSGSSYLLEDDESDTDIRQVHDDAGNTDEFIAEWLHEIASKAYKHTLVREGEDDYHLETLPDWNARLAALKEVSQQKWLRERWEKKRKKHKWSVYVFVQ